MKAWRCVCTRDNIHNSWADYVKAPFLPAYGISAEIRQHICLFWIDSCESSSFFFKRQQKDWCHLYEGRLVCRATATLSGPYRIFGIFNVTHNGADSRIHSSGPFCRSELITAVFRWRICGSLQHEDGRDTSQSLAVPDHEGQRDSPDPWPHMRGSPTHPTLPNIYTFVKVLICLCWFNLKSHHYLTLQQHVVSVSYFDYWYLWAKGTQCWAPKTLKETPGSWNSHQRALTLFCSQIWQILLLLVEVTHTLKVHHVTCHWMIISLQQLAASCWDRVPFETVVINDYLDSTKMSRWDIWDLMNTVKKHSFDNKLLSIMICCCFQWKLQKMSRF